jgi:RimJ/RimL family protein N-acetyltransferase
MKISGSNAMKYKLEHLSLIKKSKNIILQGNRIYLRILEISDASEQYCEWLNDPQINKFLMTKKMKMGELKKYIKQKRSSKNCLFYGIFLKDINTHIGNIKLEPIDFEKSEATLGILIGNKSHHGKGYCTEAVKVLCRYAFKELKLQTITLGVLLENNSAVNCYKKAGFIAVHPTNDNGIIMALYNKKRES